MSDTKYKWIAVALAFAITVVLAPAWFHKSRLGPGIPSQDRFEINPLDNSFTLSRVPEFDDYRSWAKVNTKPQFIMSPLDMLCVGPTKAQLDAEKQDPHVRHFMLCYVNAIGEHAMLHEKNPKFPVGSVIVKEKLDSPDSASKRTLLTAMIKHESGYDPAHGDWEYVVMNGDASLLQARGKLANCGGCHAQKKNTDYVFRDEMGAERLAKLR